MPKAKTYDITTGLRLRSKEHQKVLALYDAASPDGREFLMLYCEALRPDQPPLLSDNPDAEVIRRCDQMLAVNLAIEAAYRAFSSDAHRDIAIQPLDRKWKEIKGQLLKFPPPHTREGVRAAAKMMIAYVALDTFDEAVESGDALTWLTRACAEYLAGEGV